MKWASYSSGLLDPGLEDMVALTAFETNNDNGRSADNQAELGRNKNTNTEPNNSIPRRLDVTSWK